MSNEIIGGSLDKKNLQAKGNCICTCASSIRKVVLLDETDGFLSPGLGAAAIL